MATLPKAMPKLKGPSKSSAPAPILRVAPKRKVVVEKSMTASMAKTHLLELLDSVDRKREALVITKRGRPVARLVPIDKEPAPSIFGYMKGTFKITGDIVG